MENSVIVYEGDGGVHLSVKCDGETVWLTQAQMCELFGRERSVITKHVRNVFREGELDEQVVCAKFAQTTRHGAMKDGTQTREVTFYNLDVVISVGYRVKSLEGTRFRQWATKVLRTILLNGVAHDYRMEALESRVTLTENGLRQVEEGLGYLIDQMSQPTLKRIVGFGKE